MTDFFNSLGMFSRRSSRAAVTSASEGDSNVTTVKSLKLSGGLSTPSNIEPAATASEPKVLAFNTIF